VSSRRALLFLLLTACADREVALEIHTPAACCGSFSADCGEDPCPLSSLSSVRIRVERADGSLAFERCTDTAAGVCNYESLTGLTLIDGIPPSDGVELIMDGFPDPDCGGDRLFGCESLGDHQTDLRRKGQAVLVWCECPLPLP
jgi:hypothetical protein